MNIDVAKAIKELLFDNETVILPGLGGFTSSSVPATVDYVQGSVQPPARKVEFNTNLVINDGVLVHHIQQSEVVTAQDAKSAIENYVEMVKEALEQREIVDIPQVGRLYKDYEHKVRFMPEGTNFEVESFGLPTVKFNPVVRQKTSKEPVASPTKTTKAAPVSPHAPKAIEDNNSWAEKVLPALILISAILLAISLFVWLKGCSDSTPQVEVPQERVNVKPSQEDIDKANEAATADVGEVEKKESPITEATTPPPPTNERKSEIIEEKPADNQVVTPPPSAGKNIFVVVHSFGSKDNARKFARQLERAGYTPTTRIHGGLNRVGVEVPTARQNEVDSLIQELGKKFQSSPVIVDY